MSNSPNKDILFLFDVDGTLTPSRETAPPKTLHMLKELRKRVSRAFVGGSDLCKQEEQIGPDLLQIFDYGFPENGVQFWKQGKLIKSSSIIESLTDCILFLIHAQNLIIRTLSLI